MFYRITYSFIVIIVLTFISCTEKIEIPSYIKVIATDFVAGNNQGTNKQRVDFVWIYVDNKLRGAFPLNEEIPILGSINQEVKIYAGFYDNGSKSYPEINFLWEPYIVQSELNKDEVLEVEAEFKYISTIGFLLNEKFEGQTTLTKDLDSIPDTKLEFVTGDKSYDGNSGVMKVSAENINNIVANPNSFNDFGSRGGEVLLEMHYQCETLFRVGIIGLTFTGESITIPIITLFPNDNYEKIYLDIGTILTDNRIIEFQVFLQTQYNEDIEKDIQHVYIDNVKLIYNTQ